MKPVQILGLLVSGALAVSCASNSASQKTSVNKGSPTSPSASETAGPLPDAALPAGSCGMILWTLDAERPIPIFRAVSDKGAEVNVEGVVRKLPLNEFSGGSGFGVYETQTFAADGLTVAVRVRFGLGFDGGAYLERGLVTIEKPDGWKSVIPAAGIAGCRAK